MPLFLVHRTNPFRNVVDMDAAAFRGLVCAGAIPGLNWVRSYHDEGANSVICVYEADSEEDIVRHSQLSDITYDRIVPVAEILPRDFWSPDESTALGLVSVPQPA